MILFIQRHSVKFVVGLLCLLNILALILIGWSVFSASGQPSVLDRQPVTDPVTKEQLEEQIDFLQAQLEVATNATSNDIRAEFFFYLVIFTLIGAGVGVVGGQEFLKQRTREYMESLREGVDPFHLPIRIPNSDFEQEENLLRRIGFKNLHYYSPQVTSLDEKMLRGILIYAIRRKRFAEPEQALAELNLLTARLTYLNQHFTDQSLGCLLYTDHQLNLEQQLKVLPLTITANMMGTLATQIFAIARAIRLEEN